MTNIWSRKVVINFYSTIYFNSFQENGNSNVTGLVVIKVSATLITSKCINAVIQMRNLLVVICVNSHVDRKAHYNGISKNITTKRKLV